MLVVDLSNVNGQVSFPALKKAGAKGVIVKATEGVTFNDSRFQPNRNLAGAYGLYFGAYHFARPDNNSAVDEARHFCQVVKSVGSRDIKPVLDFETWANDLTPEQHVKWARDFNTEVNKRLGLYPMFYSYPSFIHRLGATKPIGNGLWLADYGVNDGRLHPVSVPAPWKKIALHQYTSNGQLPGVPEKLDLSSGSAWSILAHPLKALVT